MRKRNGRSGRPRTRRGRTGRISQSTGHRPAASGAALPRGRRIRRTTWTTGNTVSSSAINAMVTTRARSASLMESSPTEPRPGSPAVALRTPWTAAATANASAPGGTTTAAVRAAGHASGLDCSAAMAFAPTPDLAATTVADATNHATDLECCAAMAAASTPDPTQTTAISVSIVASTGNLAATTR
jgi:hypothetical protein